MERLIDRSYTINLVVLIVISTIVRLLIGSYIELGNDEVYYINYALYPDWSHFDHPPMIGWFIQLFTFNLHFNSEVWIRLASIVAGSINTLLLFFIGRKVYDSVTGWYSALLYNISFYGFVITGIFIMPDSPQMLFWLLTILLMLLSFEHSKKSNANTSKQSALYFLLAGLTLGFALLSKYTSAFLILGTLLYFIKNISFFKKWHVYAALVIAFVCFIPVLIWNQQNGFISFTFHSNRIEVNDNLFRLDSFITELTGQALYNNPFVFILIIAGVVTILYKKLLVKNDYANLLIYIGLPMILTFLGISLFRSTLPHWTGPAYVTLIPVAAIWLRHKSEYGRVGKVIPKYAQFALAFFLLILTLAILQFSHGIIFNKGINPYTGKRKGLKDITLDMYGWKQLEAQFSELNQTDLANGVMDSNAVIISHRWFPAANIDYYVAQPNSIDVLTLAPIERTHKYAWITALKGGYKIGMDAYFISSSYDFQDPHHLYTEYFNILPPDTLSIYRKDLLVEYFYVWRMKDMKKLPPDDYLVKD